MKNVVFILLLAFILSAFVSCSRGNNLPDGAISVYSSYPNLDHLVAGEFNMSIREDPQFARYGYNTYVAAVNGKLAVLSSNDHGSSNAPYVGTAEQFFFDSFSGGNNGVFLDGHMLIDEPCMALIPSQYRNKLLIITANAVYAAEKQNEKWELQSNSLTFGSNIHMAFCDWESINEDAPNELYLITETDLVVLSGGDFLNDNITEISKLQKQTLETPEWWSSIRPTSAVKTDDGTLFIGELGGVIAVRDEILYYPIDYSDAIYGADE